VLVLTRAGGTGTIEVSGRADYEVGAEDLVVARSMELVDLTTSQVNTIKAFAQAILQQIKQKEVGS